MSVAAGDNRAYPDGDAGRVADQLVDDPPGDGDSGIEQPTVALLAAGRTNPARHEAPRPGRLHVNGDRVVDGVVDPEPQRVLRQVGPGCLQRSLHLGSLAEELAGVLVGVGNVDGAGPWLGEPGRALRKSGRSGQAQRQPRADENGHERTTIADHLVGTFLFSEWIAG